jgi:2-polyprenyl-3-methyl-5-hydroxy-6-metoxy-1,4-benzoquinol methylase
MNRDKFSELFIVYPRSGRNAVNRFFLKVLLTLLLILYFLRRALSSLKGRVTRIRSSQSRATIPAREESPSSLYLGENLDVNAMSPGNCWRQMVYAVPDRVRILDVGCASGYLGKLITANKSCHVSGVEIDPEAATEAQKSYERVYVGNLSDSCFLAQIPERNYDVLLCMDVLEHLNNPADLLSHLRSRLSEKGIVLASVPNVAYWSVRFDLLRGRFDYTDTGILDKTHLRFFTLSTALDLFRAGGYGVEWIAATFPGWHDLYSPLEPFSFGERLRRNLLQTFPELLSRQFLIQARPLEVTN